MTTPSMAATSARAFQNFRPSGPVAQAFLQDRTNVARFIRGPVGGGKTVTCIFDCLSNAAAMPVCLDGKIHYRVAVIGSTYGQLERNLYETWHFWLPKDGGEWTEGEWVGGGGRFAKQVLKFDVIRGNRRVEVVFEAIFAAIGELSIEQFTRGFEPTAWYLFEVDQLPNGMVEAALGRLDRFPSATMLGRQPDYRSYVVGDLNSPDVDSWYYKLVEEVRPKGMRQYVQPSGLSPLAENLQNLAPGYYQKRFELNAHNKRWVKRFVMNEYAPSEAGEPVYADWADELFYAREPIAFDPKLPLVLCFDQGLTQPAGLALQRSPTSWQWRVLLEYVPGRMNAHRFAEGFKALLAQHCPNARIGRAWADPAGFFGADKEAGELAWAEIVSGVLGVVVQPAPSQEVGLRLSAVSEELVVKGGVPMLHVSTLCPMLRKGFASHYMYDKRALEKSQQRTPLKNLWANPHDALQYGMLGEKGRYGVISGSKGDRRGWPIGNAAGGSSKIQSSFVSGEW